MTKPANDLTLGEEASGDLGMTPEDGVVALGIERDRAEQLSDECLESALVHLGLEAVAAAAHEDESR